MPRLLRSRRQEEEESSPSPSSSYQPSRVKIIIVSVLGLIALISTILFSLELDFTYLSVGRGSGAGTRGARSASTKEIPLLHQIASTFFPIDAATGKINLPPEITTIIIDVGARNSDYLSMMEDAANRTLEPNIALILVDPLPESLIPLQERAAAYARREQAGLVDLQLNPKYKDRIFIVRAAVGEEEGLVEFNLARATSCGSILPTAKLNKFWCAETTGKMIVNVFTLKDLIDLIPERDTITSIHLKIDTEGADLLALKGAKDAIHRLTTVIHECMNLAVSPENEDEWTREGQCNLPDALDYMCQQQGICNGRFIEQGKQGNVFYAVNQTDKAFIIPEVFTTYRLEFSSWYKQVAKENHGAINVA